MSACLIAVAGLTAMIAIGGISPTQAENNAISMRRAAERKSFSDEEIKDGLFKTAFPRPTAVRPPHRATVTLASAIVKLKFIGMAAG